MKKIILFCFLLINFSTIASAQTPLAIPYQAVARTASGNLISNQTISVRFTIHDGSASGTVLYKEKHTPTTNAFGLFSVNIGTGTIISGTMASINWGINLKFLQVELDTTGGNSFIDMGTSQLMSVPYALHSKTTEQNFGKTYVYLTGEITDTEAAAIIANSVGPNTQYIRVFNTTNLTTLNLPGCTDLVNIQVTNNTALTSVTVPNCTNIFEELYINSNQALTTVSFPALNFAFGAIQIESNQNINNINLSNLSHIYSRTIITDCQITSLNLNKLTTIHDLGELIINNSLLNTISLDSLTYMKGNFEITGSPNLISLNLNSLIAVTGTFRIAYLANLANISFNNLQTLGNNYNPQSQFEIIGNALSTINFPVLSTFNSITFYINLNQTLNSINFPVLSAVTPGSNFLMSGNALTPLSVNSLLAKFVSIPGLTSCVISLAQQIPSSPPYGQGIIDKSTLISNGNNVITD